MRKSRSAGPRFFGLLFCLYSFCSLPYASAQTDLEAALRAKYEQKILMLRNFYQDDRLEYDSNGVVKGNAHPGSWTIGRVGITKIKLKGDRLELDGIRVADVYDVNASKFTSVRTSQVRIVVDRDAQTSSLENALSRVFVADSEKLADLVPPYWTAFAEGRIETLHHTNGLPGYRIRQLPKATPTNTVYRAGGGVTAPKPVFSPDPHYTPLARSKKFRGGTTVLEVIITNQGTVGEVQVVRPVGFGLDDAAVEAVQTWTFQPATKDGVPVAFQVYIEVTFRLY